MLCSPIWGNWFGCWLDEKPATLVGREFESFTGLAQHCVGDEIAEDARATRGCYFRNLDVDRCPSHVADCNHSLGIVGSSALDSEDSVAEIQNLLCSVRMKGRVLGPNTQQVSVAAVDHCLGTARVS